MASAVNNIGYINEQDGNISIAIDYYKKSLAIQMSVNDQEGVAHSYNNIGLIYYDLGDIPLAIEYYHKSISIREAIKDDHGMAQSYNNIGLVYNQQGDKELALKFYHMSLKKYQLVDKKSGIAVALNNIGRLHEGLNDYSLALEFHNKSLAIKQAVGDQPGMAISYNNIGGVYRAQKEYDLALEFYQKSLKIREARGNKAGMATSYDNIGGIQLLQGNISLAEQSGNKALELARQIGYPINIKYAAQLLTKVYEKQCNGLQSLEMYKLFITMRDSIDNKANQKASAQQAVKYEYEKQKAIDDAEHDKLLAIEQEEKQKQKILTVATAVGLVLVIMFLIFVFNRLRVTKKQKLVIEEQKLEVEKQKEVVVLAHDQLEEKNKEILDSITYAKRIQNAILPPAKVVKEYLQESFILYKPKDIVAGDFYWLEQREGKVLFAAADCTGHGVPGAMVSVVCNNALNRSVREHGLIDPGKILDKTREIVIEEFEKSDEEVKDGMDIAICSLEGNTLKYAGAHNPLWIIRNGEIIETKANKQPIGQFIKPEPYTTHTFELQDGDSIYIFSDGYVDQFGGVKGKKLKAKAFRELLLSIQDKNMEDQRNIVDESFETWRGNLEQIDDVCVIGVKV